ncbi:protein S100-A15A-like [Phascolarctos cinereus]|uniref:Protein S100-A15A-like n=1 Tax=Phascolarctos cinereus TaxID=38626 RepID=A0A6P5KQ98_PHACI|nr:protein S100-A15A-like [Phascolarctos cinereus]
MVATKLEEAVNGVMNTFHQYSRKTKDWDELSLQELTNLYKNEYPIFLSTCGSDNPDGFIKELFDKYKGQNGQVSFNNYVKILGKTANIYHKQSHNDMTCDDRR